MNETQSRIHAASIVQALRERGEDPAEITLDPHAMGLFVRVAFPQERHGLKGHGVVEVNLPPGHFAYERVAEALIIAKGANQMES